MTSQPCPYPVGSVHWHSGWYATRLHAVRQSDNARIDPMTREVAVCGAEVYVHPDGPPSPKGARHRASGTQPPRCKRCLQMLETA